MEQQSLIEQNRDEISEGNKIRIELPYPPTVNHAVQYRVQLPKSEAMRDQLYKLLVPNKPLTIDATKDFWKWLRKKAFVQTYKTQEVKEFKLNVWSAVNRLEARREWTSELRITMFIHPPDRRKRDSSNLWKLTEDALQAAGVFMDDSQIKEHHAYWSSPVSGGRVVVEIETLL